MNSKIVLRFPMQEKKRHGHNRKFAGKDTVEIAADAEDRNEKKDRKNTDDISGKVLEKDKGGFSKTVQNASECRFQIEKRT